MTLELYLSTTILSILLLILSLIAENKYLNRYEDDSKEDKRYRISLEVDLNDDRQNFIFSIVVFLILFIPVINWCISGLYGGWTIYRAYAVKK